MKARSAGKKLNNGVVTLEVLIAFAILVICISGVILVTFSNQTVAIDTETNNEAVIKAQEVLEKARSVSRQNYNLVEPCDDFDPSIVDCAGNVGTFYNRQLTIPISAATECSKEIKSTTSWTIQNRVLSVDFTTTLGDMAKAINLGGDCAISPPTGTGGDFIVGDTVNLGGDKTNGLDVFNKIVYIALQNAPGLAFINATDYTNIFQISNGYNVGSEVNDIDVARDPASGRVYAYVARETSTDQLQVIDVTDPNVPEFKYNVDLPEVAASSEPEAYRVYYYKKMLYVITKETAGPELHIFDASNPSTSLPKHSVKELNRTVNDIVVVDQTIGGTNYVVAYMAADSNLKEIGVYEISSSGVATERYSLNLLTGNPNADGLALFFSSVSKILYFGRQANSGQELYAFDATNSFTALPEKAKVEVGVNPVGLRVVGKYAYMVTDDSNDDFQVYNADPNLNLSFIRKFNATNKGTGIDYEDKYVYETMEQGSAILQVYYAP